MTWRLLMSMLKLLMPAFTEEMRLASPESIVRKLLLPLAGRIVLVGREIAGEVVSAHHRRAAADGDVVDVRAGVAQVGFLRPGEGIDGIESSPPPWLTNRLTSPRFQGTMELVSDVVGRLGLAVLILEFEVLISGVSVLGFWNVIPPC